ncbi:MAG: ribulose-phosphate 3-epimerase [Bacteroidetes bacterium]|nr:MAG: ribulose-phosphate 3-epimerase [Bacteroidota bacterium]
MSKPIIAPSILAADFCHLAREIDMIDKSQADWVHFDVMDGMFVPNISFGSPVLRAIRPLTSKVIDVHLMIEQPERYLEAFAEWGADVLSIHAEACIHIDRNLRRIKELGMKAGLAINPATPVHIYQHVLPWVDVALIMSVNPGFGGQTFIPYTYDKIRALRQMIAQAGSSTLIEVDGGVNLDNAPKLLQAGADVLVAGNFVFSSTDPLHTINTLKQLPAFNQKIV